MTAPRILLLACSSLWLSRAPADEQHSTFRSSADLVRLDVLVEDARGPIAGLTARDFDVRDSGTRQTVRVEAQDQLPVNAVLTLDTSASVTGQRLAHLVTATRSFLGGLRADDQVALFTFGDEVSLRSASGADWHPLRLDDVLRSLGTAGTALYDAASASLLVNSTRPEPTLVVILSDGLDSASWLPARHVLETARQSAAVVYGVTVGPQHATDFLDSLATTTGGRLVAADPDAPLDSTFLSILDEFRHRYVISYPYPQGTSVWHPVTVRLTRRATRSTVIRARAGYMARPGSREASVALASHAR